MSYNKKTDKCSDYKLVKLKEIANKHEIKNYSTLNKQKLCDLLIDKNIISIGEKKEKKKEIKKEESDDCENKKDELRKYVFDLNKKMDEKTIQLIVKLVPNIPINNSSDKIEYKKSSKLFKTIYNNSKKYIDSLDEEDFKYVIDYTTTNGYRDGFTIRYDVLNQYLEGKMDDKDIYYIKENGEKEFYPQRKAIRYYDKWVYNLNRILNDSPKLTKDIHVYRGISYEAYEYIYNKLKAGSVELLPRFTSTTITPSVTLGFITTNIVNPKYKGKKFFEYQKIKEKKKEPYFVDLKNPCCILDIIILKGTPVFYITEKLGKFDEDEILLPCNSIILYTGITGFMNIKDMEGEMKTVKTYTFIYRGSTPYKKRIFEKLN